MYRVILVPVDGLAFPAKQSFRDCVLPGKSELSFTWYELLQQEQCPADPTHWLSRVPRGQ